MYPAKTDVCIRAILEMKKLYKEIRKIEAGIFSVFNIWKTVIVTFVVLALFCVLSFHKVLLLFLVFALLITKLQYSGGS